MEQSILTKKQWYRRMADGTMPHPALNVDIASDGGANSVVYSQKRMLDEYYPNSHDIYNKHLYPDIMRVVEEESVDEDGNPFIEKKKYIEEVPRTAFAYQQIIETKRTDHLCGNDVTFERNWVGQDDNLDKSFQRIVDGWENYDLEDAVHLAVHESNIVGDAAVVAHLYTDEFGDKRFGWQVFSYFRGDSIYAHLDPRTDRVRLFARHFTNDYGTDIVEVWDDTYYYLFEMPNTSSSTIPSTATDGDSGVGSGASATKHTFSGGYTLDGYVLVSQQKHLFPFCPVAYRRRKEGPVWAFSQDSIEAYEEDFNGLRHNNKAYGEPILVSCGDDVEGIPEVDGTVKFINAGKDDKVSYLQAQSAADSYMKGLDKLEELIYLQSFIVKTPELKSGDLPAAALKILYSPAVEKAMHEVKEIQPFVNALVNIVRWGIGMLDGNTIDYSPSNLPIKAYIKPFVHQSESALVADINTAVANGVLSKRTGSERLSGYIAEENEWDRIVAEQKEQQQADLLYETSLSSIQQQSNQQDE